MALLTSITTVPLTTRFTPGVGCFGNAYTITDGSNDTTETSVYDGGSTYTTLLHGYTSSCYPGGADRVIFDAPRNGDFYSPGFCPGGFTTATWDVASMVTYAVCCPSSWTLGTTTDFIRTIGCTRYGDANLDVDGETIAFPAYVMQVVRGFNVRHVSSDRDVLASVNGISISTSASSTSSSTASPGASVSSTPAPTSAGTSTPEPPSPVLSTGAKAGIGVGATLGALLVLVGIVMIFRRRNQAQKPRTGLSSREDGREKPELSEVDWTGADPDFYGNEGSRAR